MRQRSTAQGGGGAEASPGGILSRLAEDFMHRRFAFALLPFAALLCGASSPARFADEFQRCAAIAADAQRLACFDALTADATASAAPTLETPPTAADVERSDDTAAAAPIVSAAPVTPPPAAPVAPTEALFGLPPERVIPPQPSVIHSTLVDLTRDARGRAIVRLANGQRWRLQENDHIWVKPGSVASVRIRKGLLGVFYLQVGGRGRGYRAKRIE